MAKSSCAWDGCNREAFAKGFCNRDYQRARKQGLLDVPAPRAPRRTQSERCSAEGCEGEAKVKGWCKPHYMRQYKHGDLDVQRTVHQGDACSVDGCDKKPHARGLCNTHFARRRRHGDANAEVQSRQQQKGLTCRGPESARPAVTKGLCNSHEYQERVRGVLTPLRERVVNDGPCAVDGCDKPALTD